MSTLSKKLFIDSIEQLFEARKGIFIRQIKEWTEIVMDLETKNKYEMLTVDGMSLGTIIERAGGLLSILKRFILRSHRPLEIDVFSAQSKVLLSLSRSFFFFLSDLYVHDQETKLLGSIHRRFSFFKKKYDLLDPSGRRFARIEAPFWRLWTFPIRDERGQPAGVITKKWQGLLKEAFTDADQFFVELDKGNWSTEQKAVVLASAISVDFDFFENNQGKKGGIMGI